MRAFGEAALDERRQGVGETAVAGLRDDSSLRRVALDLRRAENLASEVGEAIEQSVVPGRRAQLLRGGLGPPANVVVDRPLGFEHESSRSAPRLHERGDRLELCSRLTLRPRAGDQGLGLLVGPLDLIGRPLVSLSQDVVGGCPRLGQERLANRVEA